MKAENYDVVIIGSGVAALICALTLDDSINICLITKKELRAAILILHRVEYLFAGEKRIEKTILKIL